MNLIVQKQKVYGWRCNPTFSYATHGYVTVWNVVDSDSGKLVFGGASEGNNFRSTEPNLRRKKDALAFIAGFNGLPCPNARDWELKTAHNNGADRAESLKENAT